MVPASVTQAVVTQERPAVTAWAERHHWSVTIAQDGTHLDAATVHPVTDTLIVFHAELDGYPAIPPAWTCRDADGNVTLATFPVPGQRPAVPGSIFHPNHLICAPWNRLAYGSHSGPHSDWADLSAWKTIGGGVTQAHTLADMLNCLTLHLAASPATAA